MYALAQGLLGFSRSSLRVRVTRRELGYVWVVTADLCDAGTALVLDDHQVVDLPETVPAGVAHRAALVTMA